MPSTTTAEHNAYISESVVLVNIGREWHHGLTREQLFERTHGFWYCNPENHSPKYAMAVAKGIVRAVYRIRGWFCVNLDELTLDQTRLATDKSKPKKRVRWYFDGEPAPEMNLYLGKSVKHYRKHGNANPLIWINCGAERQAGIVR